MRASEVAALLDQVRDARQALWPMAASRPQTMAARAASRVRASLGESEAALHDLRRRLDAMEHHPAGAQLRQVDQPPASELRPDDAVPAASLRLETKGRGETV